MELINYNRNSLILINHLYYGTHIQLKNSLIKVTNLKDFAYSMGLNSLIISVLILINII